MPQHAKENPKTPLIIVSEAAKLIKERNAMRQHLAPFIRRVFATVDPKATYEHNWHIGLVAEYLEAMYLDQVRQLIINIPPRFLKTICCSISLPAWLLGKDPREQILASSYAGPLASRISVDCRLVMEAEWYKATFPETRFSSDQNEKTRYVTTKRGHRISTTVNSAITGDGGNWLICDDPINPRKALSDDVRKDANDWYDQTWYKRKNDSKSSKELVVMQRLHVDDTTGHLLSQGGWEHLVVPQVCEKKTIVVFPRTKKKLVRQEGALLHAKRFGTKQVEESKRRLGSYGFAAQEQQRPVPLEGGRIKLSWFKRYRELPPLEAFEETVFSMDTASGGKQINNPTVLEVYGKFNGIWYLIHVWKESVRWPVLLSITKSLATTYKPDSILVENKSSGISLIQELADDPNFGRPLVAIAPEADKITRMDTQTPSIEAGLVALPDVDFFPDATWLSSLEQNLIAFPSPTQWDELDAMSQFLKWLKKRDKKEDSILVTPFSQTGNSYWKIR